MGKLKDGLEECGFRQSNHYLYLFMKKSMICVVYVDTTIICGPDSNAIEAEIIERHQKQTTAQIRIKI